MLPKSVELYLRNLIIVCNEQYVTREILYPEPQDWDELLERFVEPLADEVGDDDPWLAEHDWSDDDWDNLETLEDYDNDGL